jgi:hypothetical protein
MKKNDGRLAGILGAVIIHLIAGIIFMSFQIRALKKNNIEQFTVEFEQQAPPPVEKNDNQVKMPESEPVKNNASNVEKILQGDREMQNIARNMASRNQQKIDPKEYENMVKEEMIKNGELGKDNFIDEWKNRASQDPDENLALASKQPKKTEEDKPRPSQVLASNYKGPTRIYYDLEGRTHTYLPLPIYRCEGSGKVVLSIEVNLKGIVERAEVIPGESTTNDQCLIETAVSTALESRFNADVNAPRIQKGTLTYHFVAQ